MNALRFSSKEGRTFNLQHVCQQVAILMTLTMCVSVAFAPARLYTEEKKGLSSCKHFHWKDFSNHLRPAVVFGVRAGLLAFLGYERFVLANSTGLMSTNVLSVSLRERLMLMFRPSVEGKR